MTTALTPATVTPAHPGGGDPATPRPIFDALSAARADDGSIVISGHVDHDGGAFPTPVAEMDDDAARWFITTLGALLDRRGHLRVAS